MINLHGYKLRFLKTTNTVGSKDYRDFRGVFRGEGPSDGGTTKYRSAAQENTNGTYNSRKLESP